MPVGATGQGIAIAEAITGQLFLITAVAPDHAGCQREARRVIRRLTLRPRSRSGADTSPTSPERVMPSP